MEKILKQHSYFLGGLIIILFCICYKELIQSYPVAFGVFVYMFGYFARKEENESK